MNDVIYKAINIAVDAGLATELAIRPSPPGDIELPVVITGMKLRRFSWNRMTASFSRGLLQ